MQVFYRLRAAFVFLICPGLVKEICVLVRDYEAVWKRANRLHECVNAQRDQIKTLTKAVYEVRGYPAPDDQEPVLLGWLGEHAV